MAAILFKGLDPFEQIVNIPLTEGPKSSLVKTGQAVSEKNMYKDYIILILIHCRLNELHPTPSPPPTIYWKSPISILGRAYEI